MRKDDHHRTNEAISQTCTIFCINTMYSILAHSMPFSTFSPVSPVAGQSPTCCPVLYGTALPQPQRVYLTPPLSAHPLCRSDSPHPPPPDHRCRPCPASRTGRTTRRRCRRRPAQATASGTRHSGHCRHHGTARGERFRSGLSRVLFTCPVSQLTCSIHTISPVYLFCSHTSHLFSDAELAARAAPVQLCTCSVHISHLFTCSVHTSHLFACSVHTSHLFCSHISPVHPFCSHTSHLFSDAELAARAAHGVAHRQLVHVKLAHKFVHIHCENTARHTS